MVDLGERASQVWRPIVSRKSCIHLSPLAPTHYHIVYSICWIDTGESTYLLNNRLERPNKRHIQPLERDPRRIQTPPQRGDIIRLRKRNPLRNLRLPRAFRLLRLSDADFCQIGVDPGYVGVAVEVGPVTLHKEAQVLDIVNCHCSVRCDGMRWYTR